MSVDSDRGCHHKKHLKCPKCSCEFSNLCPKCHFDCDIDCDKCSHCDHFFKDHDCECPMCKFKFKHDCDC